MAQYLETMVCSKCGHEAQRTSPTMRMWHGSCPKRGIRAEAPKYVPKPK